MPIKIEKHKLSDFMIKTSKTKTKSPVSFQLPYAPYTFYTNGKTTVSGHLSSDRKFVYGVHYEKHRSKFNKDFVGNKRQKNNPRVWEAVKVKDSFWMMTVYKFPLEQVKAFKQLARHFEVVLK